MRRAREAQKDTSRLDGATDVPSAVMRPNRRVPMRGIPIVLAFALAVTATGQTPELDVLVRNGQVLDGTGSAPRRTDVGIRAGRIVAVGALATQPSRRTIDASGLVVAPGFIDLHT